MKTFSAYLLEFKLSGLAKGKSLQDIADKHKISLSVVTSGLKAGTKVEGEHTKDRAGAMQIAKDHLWEDPKYYSKLKKMESSQDVEESSHNMPKKLKAGIAVFGIALGAHALHNKIKAQPKPEAPIKISVGKTPKNP